jgi:UDP-glucose 4-epimerase
MTSRRILVTGLSTIWGGRLAQALEQDPEVEAIIGVDRGPPKVELQRTEYVRVADSHTLLRRIVEAAEIDTVVDTRLVVDSIVTTPRRAHENNVIGTMNVLAACGGADSPVRKLVFKSSAHYYGCERDDPAFFTEEMRRPHAPGTLIERDIVEAEGAVESFARRNPQIAVTVLRFANGLGPDLRTSHTKLFGLPVVPAILGFDPRYQFIHEEDISGCLEHAVRHDLDGGVFNCAGDGVLVLSEVASLLGKTFAPILPPWGTSVVAGLAAPLGLRLPPEQLNLLRYGRGLDNRRMKATGFRFRYTTRETVIAFAEHLRVAPLIGEQAGEGYRYEEAVETFLRRSPSVRPTARRPEPRAPANVAPGGRRPGDAAAALDALPTEEVIALLPSLEAAALSALAEHEAANQAREDLLTAIARLQKPQPTV